MHITEKLRALWANILSLELEEIEGDANFFELGGDSVRGIQLIGEAASIKIYLDLETLFTHPTLYDLSEIISQNLDAAAEYQQNVVAPSLTNGFHPNGTQPTHQTNTTVKAAYTRPVQTIFIEAHNTGNMGLSNYVYEVEGSDVQSALESAIELLEAKNPILRTSVVENGSNFLQVLPAGGPSTFIETDNLEKYLLETRLPQIEFGSPVVQYCLVTEKERKLFVLSVHHAFFDGYSRVLIERDLLQALQSPSTYTLEELRPWYGDFATHLHSNLGSKEARQFWETYMHGATLENIHPGISGHGKCDSVWRKRIDLTQMPKTEHGHSTIIIAAWTLALANHSHLSDILFGVIKLGRAYPYDGIERLHGLLAVSNPFRLQIGDASDSTTSFLQRVQLSLVSSSRYEHEDIPAAMPNSDGQPFVQSMVNIKSGLAPIPPTVISGTAAAAKGAGISKLTPRRDLENWDFDMEGLSSVNLDVTVQEDEILLSFRYMSELLGPESACRLFDDFVGILNGLWCDTDGKVSDLVKAG